MALGDLPTGDLKRVRVRDMFDRIAPHYDALNRVMSIGMDQRWRRRALERIDVAANDLVVDLACGTGDFCELVEERGARAVGVDFALQMLRQGRERRLDFRSVQGDGEWLPFRSASVDVVTCGFAMRNFVSLPRVLQEIARILKPGGRAALIDVDRPDWAPIRAAHSLYFDHVVPMVGGLVSDRKAYRYLPQSTAYLPSGEELKAMLSATGFLEVDRESLFLGAAQILTGVRGPLTPIGGPRRVDAGPVGASA